MKIIFLGATHEVTGSCYYLEGAGRKFLVDCGMEQDVYKRQGNGFLSVPKKI